MSEQELTLGQVAETFQAQQEQLAQAQKELATSLLLSAIESGDPDNLVPVAALVQAVMTGKLDSFLAQDEHAGVLLAGMVPDEMLQRLSGGEDLFGGQLESLPLPQSLSEVASEPEPDFPSMDEHGPAPQRVSDSPPVEAADSEEPIEADEPIFEPVDKGEHVEVAVGQQEEEHELWNNWIKAVQVPGAQKREHFVPLEKVLEVAVYKSRLVAGVCLSPSNLPPGVNVERFHRDVIDPSMWDESKYKKFVRSAEAKVLLNVLQGRKKLNQKLMETIVDMAGDTDSNKAELAKAVVTASPADEDVVVDPTAPSGSPLPASPASLGERGEPTAPADLDSEFASQESGDRQDTPLNNLVALLGQESTFDSPKRVAEWVVNNMSIQWIESRNAYWVNMRGFAQKDLVKKVFGSETFVKYRPEKLGLSIQRGTDLGLEDMPEDNYLNLADFVKLLEDMKLQDRMVDEKRLGDSNADTY